jgi:Tfp pilus assembly protein PilF
MVASGDDVTLRIPANEEAFTSESMLSNRQQVLKQILEQNPTDSFARYGLAMEYLNAGDAEKAVEEFLTVLDHNPDYVAAYFHGGQALERAQRVEDAKALYRRGIEACARTGDWHTRSELQAALDLLSD